MGPKIADFRPAGDQSWSQWAECAKPDAPLMFPHETDRKGQQAAKSTCDNCPVRAECLDVALASGERFGIWGGLDPDERLALRKRQQRRKQPSRINRADERKKAAARRKVAEPRPVADVDTAGLL